MSEPEDKQPMIENNSPEPYSSIISQTVAKIQDEPFLFIIAIVSLIVGLTMLATELGSDNLRFVIVIIALLAFAGIIGNYLREAQKMQAKLVREGLSKQGDENGQQVEISPTGEPKTAGDDSPKPTSSIDGKSFANLDRSTKNNLVNAFQACSSFRNRDTRDVIVEDLREEIRSKIIRHASEKVDTRNIVRTCLDFPGGLSELINVVRFYEGGNAAMQDLDNVVEKIYALSDEI